jgi:hypothetical protein
VKKPPAFHYRFVCLLGQKRNDPRPIDQSHNLSPQTSKNKIVSCPDEKGPNAPHHRQIHRNLMMTREKWDNDRQTNRGESSEIDNLDRCVKKLLRQSIFSKM